MERGCNLTYDLTPRHNGFDGLPWMDMIISRDPLYSSLDIVPSHNQCLLPGTIYYSKENLPYFTHTFLFVLSSYLC